MKHTVTEHQLKSGAKGLLIDVPGSSVINVVVRFNSGYQFADQTRYEIPHVMEHLLATVTQKYSAPNAYMIEAQKRGAYVNAHTSAEYNGYVFECAVFEIDRMLDLMEEQLVRPLFAAEPLKAEIGNVREELSRNTTEHGKVVGIRLEELTYPGRAKDYEARIKQLDNIAVKDMKDHYEATHTANNARFYVSGALADKTKYLDRLERIFSQLLPGERKRLNLSQGLGLKEPITTTGDIAQIYYAIAFYASGLTLEERRAAHILRLVLAGGFQSRILGELRQKGLAYAFGLSASGDEFSSEVELSAFVTPDHSTDAFMVMAKHLKSARSGEIGDNEIADAKQLGIGATQRSIQTPSDLMGWYIGRYDREELILPVDEYLALLESVSTEDVAAVARKLLHGSNFGSSFLGDITPKRASEFANIFSPIWQ